MKLLFLTGIIGILTGVISQANAKDISIFEIRRNIPLSDDQPVYKDYYINAGDSAGLKENMVVMVSRVVPIKFSAIGEAAKMLAPVGRLKLIHVQGDMAVGRLFEMPGREKLPMLEQTGILIGDRIDLKTAKVEKKSPKASDTLRAPAAVEKFELNGELWEPPTAKIESSATPSALPVAPAPSAPVNSATPQVDPVASANQPVGQISEKVQYPGEQQNSVAPLALESTQKEEGPQVARTILSSSEVKTELAEDSVTLPLNDLDKAPQTPETTESL